MKKFRNFIKDIGCLLSLVILISCTEDTEASIPPSQSDVSISGTLPVLYIDTENHSPIVSKEEYLNAFYRLDPMGIEGIEALGTKDEPLPLQIRGRGHSSWKAAKKPYKIKLEQKTSIMGMPKNKHWALLKPSENTVAGLQLGGCIKNKLFDTLFLYIAIESAKIIKRPIFGDFPKIFDSRGV